MIEPLQFSSREALLADLATVLSNFQGREYSGEINAGTLFFSDLEFASIDAVILGEELENRYARKFPFGRFLAELRDSGAEDMSVGMLADFIFQEMQ